jgi:hypothetical protein
MVSYLLWVDYFFDESSREEFSYFPFDSLPFIRGKTAKSLLLWYSLWIHIKTMLDQLFGHPWPIRWFPCEYVSVSPQEADEREFLFAVVPPAQWIEFPVAATSVPVWSKNLHHHQR